MLLGVKGGLVNMVKLKILREGEVLQYLDMPKCGLITTRSSEGKEAKSKEKRPCDKGSRYWSDMPCNRGTGHKPRTAGSLEKPEQLSKSVFPWSPTGTLIFLWLH